MALLLWIQSRSRNKSREMKERKDIAQRVYTLPFLSD
jgi:hypothetical protein